MLHGRAQQTAVTEMRTGSKTRAPLAERRPAQAHATPHDVEALTVLAGSTCAATPRSVLAFPLTEGEGEYVARLCR